MLVLFIVYAIALSDQATKYLIRMNFFPDERLPVIPGFFDLTYVKNTGAAYGILRGLNGYLVLVSFITLAVLIAFRRSFLSNSIFSRTAMGLIVGGIIGNLMDRLRLTYVVDFFDFHWKSHHFPAFNIADSAICVGVALYLLSCLQPSFQKFLRKEEQPTQKNKADEHEPATAGK